jgi:hypothetical protein
MRNVQGAKGRRRVRSCRTWRLSPDGFRALRHSCFLSRQACADFLGVSLRTVRHWDAGRCRVPWAVVRLLRFVRLGDLGALDAAWDGWTLNRNGLWSPDGKRYHQDTMRHWWITSEQARFWREDYDRRNPVGGVGASAPAATLLTSQAIGAEPAGTQPVLLPEAEAPPAVPLTAFLVVGGVFPVECTALRREDAGPMLGDFSHLALVPTSKGFGPVECEALCRVESLPLEAPPAHDALRLVPTFNKGLKPLLWLHSGGNMPPQAISFEPRAITSEATA